MSAFTYDVLIEQPMALKTGGGFRFNAYFWQLYNETLTLDFFVKGFRVFGGKIHLPAYSSRQPFPNVYLPLPFAEALVAGILSDKSSLKEMFPHAFPLMNSKLLSDELQYPSARMLGDFPKLAAARGLLDVS